MTSARVDATLADGRELIYFDDTEPWLSGAATRDAVDHRPLGERAAPAQMRLDPLTGDWVAIAGAPAEPHVPAAGRRVPAVPHRPRHRALARSRPATTTSSSSRTASPRSRRLAGAPDRRPATRLLAETPGARPVRGRLLHQRPRRGVRLADPPRARTVIDAWADRTAALSAIEEVEQVFCFENRGQEIGVTLHHPHGQIYAYPYVAPRTRQLLAQARAHHERTGRLLGADILDSERRDGVARRPLRRALDRLRPVRRPLAGRGAPRAAPRRARPVALDGRRARRAGRGLPGPAAAPRPLLRRRGRRPDRAAVHRRLAPGAGARGPRRVPAAPAGHVGAARARQAEVPRRLRVRRRRVGQRRTAGAGRRAAAGGRAPDDRPDGRRDVRRAVRLRRRTACGRRPGGSTSSASTPTTTTGSACRSRCRSALRRGPAARGPHVLRVVVRADRRAGHRLPRRRRARHARRLGGLRRRGRLGAASRRGTGARRSTSSSTAACRWAPACRSSAALECARRRGAVRPVRARASGTTTPPGPGSPRSAPAPRTHRAGARPAAWTSRRRCAAPPGHAMLLDCRDGSVEQVPFDLAAHDLALLVMDTRAEHAPGRRPVRASGAAAASRPPPSSGSPACARCRSTPSTRRWRRLADDPSSGAGPGTSSPRSSGSGDGRPAARGPARGGRAPLFDASHASMRDDFEISAPSWTSRWRRPLAHGALGARMTGGGFGGSAIALVPAGAVEPVSEAVTKAFADHGFASPSCFAVTASGPAGRDA